MSTLGLPPPDWWRPWLTEEQENWLAAYYAGQLPDPFEAGGLRHVEFRDDSISNATGRIVIWSPPDEWFGRFGRTFIVGEQHCAYEWAMALGDRNPYHPLWYAKGGVGVDDERRADLRVEAIKFTPKTKAIFKAIITAYKNGTIKAVLDWYEEPSDDLTRLRFRQDDILKVISELGADGAVIRMLLAEREQRTDGETADADGAGGESPAKSERQIRPIPASKLRKYLEDKKGGPIPAADKLFNEVVDHFSEYHVTREDVRTMHTAVWGRQHPGRRRKNSTK
jgi:hypothetical protein